MKAMQLTREAVARKMAAYLHQEISLNELVAWANVAMITIDFEETYYDAIRDTIARLSLADLQAFELTWEDYASILKRLGDDVREGL